MPETQKFTQEQMEEAVECIGGVKNIDEWREAVLSEDGPLHGCEILPDVEQLVINELYREHQDDCQRSMELFNLRNRMN